MIYVIGVDAEADEMNKLLGRKWRLCCIDEASMYTINLRNLVYGVLGPAMTDPNAGGESGTICLMGTASDFPQGLFFDVTTGKESGWKLYEWTAHDNPYVAKQWQEGLEKIAADRPLYMETPQFRQWYLNHWVIDEEKLVYRFGHERNLISPKEWKELVHKLPHDSWAKVLGVDTGWEDDNAFILSAYHQNDPTLYIIKMFCRKQMYFDDKDKRPEYGVIQKLEEMMADKIWAPEKVVIDGANKQGVESMSAVFNPVRAMPTSRIR